MKVTPEDKFDPKKILPPNAIIKSIDSHLYRIGLSLFPVENRQRSVFYNPKLIFIILYQFLYLKKTHNYLYISEILDII